MSKEQLKKYPKIKHIGDPKTRDIDLKGKIFITEKYDGCNFRFRIKNGEIICGTRNTIINDKPDKQFINVFNYIKDKVEVKEEYEKYTFFGENMMPHSIEYDWDKIPQFLGFDIYNHDKNRFVSWDKALKIFDEIGLETVRTIDVVFAENLSEKDMEIPESEFRDGKAEGIVLKNYETQVFAKKHSEEFTEKNRKTFGKHKKECNNDNERFVRKYCTNTRIEKCTYKLRDEGYKLEMPLMKHLPKKVYKDIWEENMEEIISKRWTIDLNRIRSLISGRCASVLKRLIEKEAFRNKNK